MQNMPISFRNYTLFLDRDGVINRRLPGEYIKHYSEFEFLPGVLQTLKQCANIFKKIVIVTNQQGIGKGLMHKEDLQKVHQLMLKDIEANGGRIDGIYFCPELASQSNNCRKPASTMALRAQADFPEIDFKKSIMVGDTLSDMEFGSRLNMYTILVETNEETAQQIQKEGLNKNTYIDLKIKGLHEFPFVKTKNNE